MEKMMEPVFGECVNVETNGAVTAHVVNYAYSKDRVNQPVQLRASLVCNCACKPSRDVMDPEAQVNAAVYWNALKKKYGSFDAKVAIPLVTQEMMSFGAGVIEELHESFDGEGLAKEIYMTMYLLRPTFPKD